MERKLTDEEISEICMFMRVSDFMKKNQHIVDEKPELKQMVQMLEAKVGEIMEALSQEQLDEILEEHKMQLEVVAKQKDNKPTGKQKKSKPRGKTK